jgi:predicted nucleic acid-binding protein
LNLRIFLDANILFTAAYSPEGLSSLLFDLRRRKILALLTSEHALEEARVNLQIKKSSAIDHLSSMTGLLELVHAPAASPVSLELPEDDLLIFAAAVAGSATHLLTGDSKHFGRYFNKPNKTAGIQIQTVRQFFDERF